MPDDLTFFATDVDDLVDIGQEAYVTFQNGENFFLPDTFAPYYDGKVFLVEPLPLVQGKPVKITVPLYNRTKSPADLTATFSAHEWNIGSPTWSEIGKVEHTVLQPGETKEVSINWAPDQPSTHLCFQIVITGQIKGGGKPVSNALCRPCSPYREMQACSPCTLPSQIQPQALL